MTPTHPLGQIVRDDAGVSLRFERHLTHPPARVWRALTESDQLRHWFPADIVGPREEGAEVVVPFWDDVAAKFSIDDPVLTGRIVTWDPPHRFAWEWEDEVLTYDLEPLEGGTRLTLQVRIGSRSPGADQVGAGYHMCLDQLVTLVETGTAPPFIDLEQDTYVADYAAIDAAST
ncbi:MAG: SRPBCC family protein [Acidimicrobiales bacterium]